MLVINMPKIFQGCLEKRTSPDFLDSSCVPPMFCSKELCRQGRRVLYYPFLDTVEHLEASGESYTRNGGRKASLQIETALGSGR